MWIIPTRTDLTRALTGPELEAVETAAVESGAPDPLPGTLAAAVQLARGYIAACPRNRLGPADSIPDALLSSVVAIARWNLLTRFPDVGLTSDARRAEYSDALTTLRDCAACKFAVEAPPDEPAAPEAVHYPEAAAGCRELRVTLNHTEGL
ncbi:MAG: DUF1320 domain-containing protein [Opitutaceae bacterium]|jgi:hypothetical protein|nr:DUF1320 domain-containing protein [Opitutaceae bacterium]